MAEMSADPVLQIIILMFKPLLLHSGQNVSVIFSIRGDQTREAMRRMVFASCNQAETLVFRIQVFSASFLDVFVVSSMYPKCVAFVRRQKEKKYYKIPFSLLCC